MQTGKASGNQIAFLIIISWMLMVPTSRFLEKWLGLQGEWQQVFDRFFTVISVAVVFALVGPLRRASIAALSQKIRPEDRTEVAIVSLVMPIHLFAFAGAVAFWFNFTEGPLGLQQRLQGIDSHAREMEVAFHAASFVGLFLAVVIGPIVEEVLFRAFLYRAWAERYGCLAGMVLSSSLFAMLHANFFPSFLGGIAFTCVYRRTGSLHAGILVHAATNLAAYYPLLGRFVFPRDMPDPGDLQHWTWHVVALFVTLILWPIYVWMAREHREETLELEEAHAALPR